MHQKINIDEFLYKKYFWHFVRRMQLPKLLHTYWSLLSCYGMQVRLCGEPKQKECDIFHQNIERVDDSWSLWILTLVVGVTFQKVYCGVKEVDFERLFYYSKYVVEVSQPLCWLKMVADLEPLFMWTKYKILMSMSMYSKTSTVFFTCQLVNNLYQIWWKAPKIKLCRWCTNDTDFSEAVQYVLPSKCWK